MKDTNLELEPAHPAVIRRRRLPLVWLVPAVAALIGLSMLVHAWLSAGAEITIACRTATGLEAGKTPVKYKGVTVGEVKSVALSDDGSHAIVIVALDKSATSLTRRDTRFWVVRPRVGTGGISGLDTLLSGAYIAADVGTAKVSAGAFTELETPPTVVAGTPGKSFTLHGEDLGSLDIGSSIYYRRIQVGRVASYKLDADGKSVNLQIFIDAPYDRFVTTDTRFWNASGVDVSLGADGLKLKTQSMATIVAGGIAFAAPDRSQGSAAAEHAEFVLAKDQETALAPPDGPGQYMQLRFAQSLRGLTVGAPVLFAGVTLGSVVSMNLDYDQDNRRFPTMVGIVVYPQRLGPVLDILKRERDRGGDSEQHVAQFLQKMVEHGLRAQACSGNLLTGQLYISLDVVPNAPKVAFDVNARPLAVPTIDGTFDRVQEQVASIVGKIDKLPLASIANHLDTALAGLGDTLRQVNGQVLPETTRTLVQAQQTFGAAQGMLADDAPLQQDLGRTLQEVQHAARSLRTLTELLGRHPQSLLRGVPDDAPAGAVPARQPTTTTTTTKEPQR
ncbi:PqiB family protein [Rugamonas apoptosis]|uniref:MCE family protein n=1 Tax=Rugamonas apoptosis TaxID=2758570 RepID=A0A7W2IML9_9BURK|nr:MlaD family protein [Rugamonas apoptosis]MBA5689925.1 MCE family protein [Rugamonas apoptosis]